MSLHLAEEQLDVLSDSQVEMYDIKYGGERDNMFTPFFQEYSRSIWHTVVKSKMDNNTARGGGSEFHDVNYIVNNNFHYLLKTRMCFTLPAVTVKPEYVDKVRIAWCHNVGINIIVTASFYENDNRYSTIDPVWIDDNMAWFQSPGSGKRNGVNIGIGKVPILEDWTTTERPSLPSYEIDWVQPWFYSEHTFTAFPIFYLGKNCKAEHRYTFRNLKDLLRVQKLKGDEWVDLVNRREIDSLVEFSSSTHVIPDLWADYAFLTKLELVWHKSECHGLEDGHSYYIKDIESFDSPNPAVSGSTTENKLSCNNPALAIFWKAENEKAMSNHNFSNYTTNDSDVYDGWDPIKYSTIQTEGKNKIIDRVSSHHVNVGVMDSFPSAPAEAGYHALSFTHDCKDYDINITLHLGKLQAILLCTLGNTDIYQNIQGTSYKDNYSEKWENSNGSVNSSRSYTNFQNREFYNMKVRVLVCRKFSIRKNKEGFFNFMVA